MPDYPPAPGRRCITLELPAEHVQHLDARAAYLGCTRAAYIRQLIVRDQERLAAADNASA